MKYSEDPKRFGNTTNEIQISTWVQPGLLYTDTSTFTTGTVYCATAHIYSKKFRFTTGSGYWNNRRQVKKENGNISIGLKHDISGDAFAAVAKAGHSIIPLGSEHGVEMIDFTRAVRLKPRRGTRTR